MYLFDQISEAGLSSLCARWNGIFYWYDIYDKSYPIADSPKSDKVTANPTRSIVLFTFPFLFCVTSGVTSLSANPVPPVVRIRSTLPESAQETWGKWIRTPLLSTNENWWDSHGQNDRCRGWSILFGPYLFQYRQENNCEPARNVSSSPGWLQLVLLFNENVEDQFDRPPCIIFTKEATWMTFSIICLSLPSISNIALEWFESISMEWNFL